MKTLSLPLSPDLMVRRKGQPAVERVATSDGLTLASDLLMRGRKVIQIEHNGSLYQLRATKLGKLILTK